MREETFYKPIKKIYPPLMTVFIFIGLVSAVLAFPFLFGSNNGINNPAYAGVSVGEMPLIVHIEPENIVVKEDTPIMINISLHNPKDFDVTKPLVLWCARSAWNTTFNIWNSFDDLVMVVNLPGVTVHPKDTVKFSIPFLLSEAACVPDPPRNIDENATEETFLFAFVLTVRLLDLKIADSNEDYSEGVSTSWTLNNMKPGDSVSSFIRLRNFGDIKANHTEINTTNTVTESECPEPENEVNGCNTTDMDKVMIVTVMTYSGENLLATNASGHFSNFYIEQADASGVHDHVLTLDELEKVVIDNLTAPAPNQETTVELVMTIKFNESAGNAYLGDSVTAVFKFTLNEHPNQ